PNWTPGRLVGIAPKGPRNPRGASGFGSHVSMCPGPPLSQKRMTLRRVVTPDAAADSRSLSRSGTVSPPSPSSPAWTKLRRVIPSRSPAALPKTLSIAVDPLESGHFRLRERFSHVKRPEPTSPASPNRVDIRRLPRVQAPHFPTDEGH